MQIHPLCLLPGHDLRQQLQAYVQQHQLQAAFVVTCCGSKDGSTAWEELQIHKR